MSRKQRIHSRKQRIKNNGKKTIASLRNNKVIVSKINEAKAREIIHQEFKHQFKEMTRE
jgi:hypothetical protein